MLEIDEAEPISYVVSEKAEMDAVDEITEVPWRLQCLSSEYWLATILLFES